MDVNKTTADKSHYLTATEKDCERRGMFIGGTMMLDRIKNNLFYRGLLSEAVRDALDAAKQGLVQPGMLCEKCIPDVAIEYNPVCGNCGAPVTGNIICKEYFIECCLQAVHEITPSKCPCCGGIFNRIVMTPPKVERGDDML